MKIIILGGFLGSGKTSVLLQLAEYLASHSKNNDSATKVMIIENEIGEKGIDNQLIEGNGYNVRNLFAGCVCCSLSVELVSAVKNISLEFDPEWLIVEATGVAYPAGIKKSLSDSIGMDSFIMTVVDAPRWKRLSTAMETLVLQQLEGADMILINKIDQVSPETIEETKKHIETLRELAEIFQISAIEKIREEVWLKILKFGGKNIG